MKDVKSMTAEQTIPRYLNIAVDICVRIVNGDIPEGGKLKGRSVLSSEYNVSPETIRRAMSLLSDKDVVQVFPGSGIVVRSRENAVQFLKSFKDEEGVTELRDRLSKMMQNRRKLDEDIDTLTGKLIDLYKSRHSNLIKPIEISLPDASPVIGQSIGKLEVWHNTGATILGVIRNGSVVVSPGPYFEFVEGDRVLIVGDQSVIQRFNIFINGI